MWLQSVLANKLHVQFSAMKCCFCGEGGTVHYFVLHDTSNTYTVHTHSQPPPHTHTHLSCPVVKLPLNGHVSA